MAKSKPKSSIKLSSNWEKNMAALGTPAKSSASKSSSSKSSSSKSSASKPSSPAKSSSPAKGPVKETATSSYTHPLKGSTSVIYKKPAPSKASSSKPSKPASQVIKPSSSEYSKMTPAQRNANTLAGIKESINKYPSKPAKPASSAKVPAKSPAKPAAPAKTPAKPATAPAKTPAKTPAVVAPAKPAGKTVSQVWKEKTGMDWSEAKKLGVSDGSAKSNMALLAKLNSGAMSRADLGVKTEPIVMATKKVETIESPSPELETKRKGGSVKMKKKYRMGGMKKKSC